MEIKESRLLVVDALRGFAIVSIMLIHNIEHFNFLYYPVNLPPWMLVSDKIISKILFFLFNGKSYAIFALLFGLTFFIQYNNQQKKGNDFRGRFVWRLIILLVFGIINSIFFESDILSIYAVIGLFLFPVARLSNKIVFWIALILMLQPYEWINFFIAISNPDKIFANPVSWAFFEKSAIYLPNNSMIKTMIGNLTNGRLGFLFWTWESGRTFQTLSLFLIGMLVGRKSLFLISKKNTHFWIKALIISIISFIPLFIINKLMSDLIINKSILRPLLTIGSSWSNVSFMLSLVSGFVLLFHTRIFHHTLNAFSYIGRMSLSNYMMQSVLGSFIYYGFGLALYQYTGATYCLLIGIVLSVLQWFFSYWWLIHHNKGPLETIWHNATWIGFKKTLT